MWGYYHRLWTLHLMSIELSVREVWERTHRTFTCVRPHTYNLLLGWRGVFEPAFAYTYRLPPSKCNCGETKCIHSHAGHPSQAGESDLPGSLWATWWRNQLNFRMCINWDQFRFRSSWCKSFAVLTEVHLREHWAFNSINLDSNPRHNWPMFRVNASHSTRWPLTSCVS